MAFDVDKMFQFCRAQIQEFAEEHPDETFYAFAIDASMLCLNSVERFTESLKHYQDDWDRRTRRIDAMSDMTAEDLSDEEFTLELAVNHLGLDPSDDQACLAEINEGRDDLRAKGCKYRTEEGIRSLKESTGDWNYQGFASFDDEVGFDHRLYRDHYDEAGESDDGHAPTSPYAIAMTEWSNDCEPAMRSRDSNGPRTSTSPGLITTIESVIGTFYGLLLRFASAEGRDPGAGRRCAARLCEPNMSVAERRPK